MSVLIPCYNYGRFLPECLASVLSQDVAVDVLVVDDASTDGSDRVVEALGATDPRIRTLLHTRNHGHVATFNEGLAMLDGDYLVLISADDMLTPGALGRAVSLMEANPSVGLVYGNPAEFTDLPPRPRTRVRSWTVWPGQDWIRRQCRRGTNSIYSPEAVVRRTVQRQVGDYDPDLPHAGDLQMWLRFAAVADVARVNGVDQAFRRMHGQNMMQTTFAGGLVDLRQRLEAYDRFFASAGAHLPDAQRDAAAARRSLANDAAKLVTVAIKQTGHPPDDADAYFAFALGVDPDVRTRWQWQEAQLLVRQAGGSRRGVRSALFAVANDVDGRWRWRRWHWSGT